jgi:hypothetical protein
VADPRAKSATPGGADSYLIDNGRIHAQTIHYTLVDDTGNILIRADGTRP